jgi:hypothetical protein
LKDLVVISISYLSEAAVLAADCKHVRFDLVFHSYGVSVCATLQEKWCIKNGRPTPEYDRDISWSLIEDKNTNPLLPIIAEAHKHCTKDLVDDLHEIIKTMEHVDSKSTFDLE